MMKGFFNGLVAARTMELESERIDAKTLRNSRRAPLRAANTGNFKGADQSDVNNRRITVKELPKREMHRKFLSFARICCGRAKKLLY